jgi:chymotrypsin
LLNFNRAIVTPHTHPYQAGLLMSFSGGTGLCGGSVISPTVVLTAAHCPIGSSSTQVILGAHTLTANEATQQRRTVSSAGYRLHQSYNPSNLNNDIATLILPNAVAATAQVQWSVLPALGVTDTFAGQLATVSGWGRIADGSSATSAQLRSVQNNIITNAVCASTFGSTIVASTLCISTAGGRGTCNGDSGNW